jgi:hypothetical protein
VLLRLARRRRCLRRHPLAPQLARAQHAPAVRPRCHVRVAGGGGGCGRGGDGALLIIEGIQQERRDLDCPWGLALGQLPDLRSPVGRRAVAAWGC